MSKIELTQKLIATLPKPENKGYVLADSWYSCKDIFNDSEKAGYSYIGALKTNRVIFPQDHERLGIKLYKFATLLNIEEFYLVTVKDKQYYIYNYVFSVATCGDDAGNAIGIIKKELNNKEMTLNSGFSIIMPNNYIILGDVDSKEVERRKLENAKNKIKK